MTAEHLSLCEVGGGRRAAAGGQRDEERGQERHGAGQVSTQSEINGQGVTKIFTKLTFLLKGEVCDILSSPLDTKH